MPAWFLAPLVALWVYAVLTVVGEASPVASRALGVIGAVGAYSGKTAWALAAFVATATAVRRTSRSWERWALVLPGLYGAAMLATFPPLTAGLAEALRLALAWVGAGP